MNQDLELDEQDELELERLLHDPSLKENPLLPAMEKLYRQLRRQRQQLDKLLKIADGFDNLVQNEKQSLFDRYARQIRRLEKIARISDLYQKDIIRLNDQLAHASLHDPLTDLPNRRYLTSRLKELTALALRHGRPYSVMLLDLDHFKSVNDYYGHEVGDQVLCQLAEILRPGLRSCDICGRWGGEEFLLLLPDSTLPAVEELGERLLANVKAHRWSLPRPLFPDQATDAAPSKLTFSAGITTYRPQESYQETIRRADDAMYQAKAQGRGRVVCLR